MALPISKQELADWILRRLGAPLVNIELSDEQLEDAIDEAVQFYHLYHYDGAERTYRTIKLTDEILTGNARRPNSLNAPMFDHTIYEDYRIGDRVMIYKDSAHTAMTPKEIWVKYDSDERILKSFYKEYSAGNYFLSYTDSGDSEQKADSDGAFVLYDSDVHNAFEYFIEAAGSFVDSEGAFVLYDSDKHIVPEYIVELLAAWTDSDDSEKVLYDSDKHILLNYYIDSEGSYVDSEGTFVLYDSDTHIVHGWVADSEGTHVDSDGNIVLFDSDKYVRTVYDFVAGPHNLLDSEIHNYYYLTSEIIGATDSEYVPFLDGVDVVYEYPRISQTLARKNNIDSDTVLVIDATKIKIASDIRQFQLRGTTEAATDSDGYGSLLSFPELDGLRLDFDVQVGSINVKTYLLDNTVIQETLAPKADGFISIDNIDSEATPLVFNAEYTRHWINSFAQLYVANNVPVVTDRYRWDTIDVTRYARSSSYPTRYRRGWTYPVRYNRKTNTLGNRYDRVDSEIYRTYKTWNELWRKEDVVLNEPQQQFDYSKEGQIGIPVPDNIIGINKVMRIDNFAGIGMWNYEYQFFLNNFDFFFGNGGSGGMPMTNYYTQKSYIDLIDNLMNVQPAIRFNKNRNKLYIDTNWTRIKNSAKAREYHLMVECYEVNDPEIYGDVYKDAWLKRYSVALAKQQWGMNLKKYSNMELPGGIMVDGQALYAEAKEEVDALEEELRTNQYLEVDFIIG